MTMVIKAVDNDMIGGDAIKPFRRVKKVLKKGANQRDRVLSVKEFHDLYRQAKPHLRAFLTFGYWAGMRRGEIMGLTWDMVDLENRVISLEAEDTKEAKPKRVPIGGPLLATLRKIPRSIHDNHVLTYRGVGLVDGFKRSLIMACKKAGVIYGRDIKGGFVFHDLRHTFITDMRRAGVPRIVTMSITGHAARDVHDRYHTITDTDRIDAITRLEVFRRNNDQVTTTEGMK